MVIVLDLGAAVGAGGRDFEFVVGDGVGIAGLAVKGVGMGGDATEDVLFELFEDHFGAVAAEALSGTNWVPAIAPIQCGRSVASAHFPKCAE